LSCGISVVILSQPIELTRGFKNCDMEFEFAKYTEITDLAFEVNPNYKNEGYVRFFICPDVWDFWFVRILKGQENDDEQGYIENENNYILERDKVEMNSKGEKLTVKRVKEIISNDSGESWDLEQSEDIDELIEMLDDSFGILNLKSN